LGEHLQEADEINGMLIWRIAWHSGFGGTKTDETTDPIGFIHQLHQRSDRVDWVSVYGAYYAT